MNVRDFSAIFLAAQVALLREIPSNLRAVTMGAKNWGQEIDFFFYFDGEITDDQNDLVSTVMCELTAGLPNDPKGGNYVKRLDYPQKIPDSKYFIFLRDESHLPSGNVNSVSKARKNKMLDQIDPSWILLRLRLQEALIGRVAPHLRCVKADFDEWKKRLYFWFYYDGQLTERDEVNTKNIIQEVLFYFNGYNVEKTVVKLDYPIPIPSIGESIYYRKEEPSEIEKANDAEWSSDISLGYFLERVQIVLLGKIMPELRAIKAGIDQDKKTYSLWFYWAETIGDEERILGEKCRKEIMLGMEWVANIFVERIPLSQPIPLPGCYVYLRYEESIESISNSDDALGLNQWQLPWLSVSALRLKAQRELLGKVTSNLRAVKIALDECKKIYYVWCYYDGVISNVERQLVDELVKGMRPTDAFEPCAFVEQLDFPQVIPHIGHCVYLRFEKGG